MTPSRLLRGLTAALILGAALVATTTQAGSAVTPPAVTPATTSPATTSPATTSPTAPCDAISPYAIPCTALGKTFDAVSNECRRVGVP
ncbi:MAG: hypothetical protein ACJ72E_03790, partial [Marmoricola sp.]